MADDNERPTAVAEPEEQTPTNKPKAKRGRKAAKKKATGGRRGAAARTAYPKHSLAACLRIPQGILEQNAGDACTPREAVGFAKLGWTGELGVEISSATKYGLLE